MVGVFALGSIGEANGGSGNDRLFGGGGADFMGGGTGSDVFVFDTRPNGTTIDRLVDFDPAADLIRLDDAAFAGLALGALPAGAFVANATGLAADAGDRITYETDTGLLRHDADGAGGAPGLAFARLNPGLAMSAGDFAVV